MHWVRHKTQTVAPLVNNLTSEVIKNVVFLTAKKPRKPNEYKLKATALNCSVIKLDINKCISPIWLHVL